MSDQFERLFAKYERLSLKLAVSKDRGPDKSVDYFCAEQTLICDGNSLDMARDRVSTWVRTVREVDLFQEVHGRPPRVRGRNQHSHVPKSEARLGEWLRYQRRPAVHVNLSRYQVERLECLAYFSWDPVGDRWDDKLLEYVKFVVGFDRQPRYRSPHPDERRLAGWAAKQRYLIGRGMLSHGRMVEFHAVTNLRSSSAEQPQAPSPKNSKGSTIESVRQFPVQD